MGQLIDGFKEYREQKSCTKSCENCEEAFQGMCQVKIPEIGTDDYKWLEKAVAIVMARQLEWPVEKFTDYLDANAKSLDDVIKQYTSGHGTLVLRNHSEINDESDCPFHKVSSYSQSSLLEDVVDYAKTLKFSFK